jgi:hypothetical protein
MGSDRGQRQRRGSGANGSVANEGKGRMGRDFDKLIYTVLTLVSLGLLSRRVVNTRIPLLRDGLEQHRSAPDRRETAGPHTCRREHLASSAACDRQRRSLPGLILSRRIGMAASCRRSNTDARHCTFLCKGHSSAAASCSSLVATNLTWLRYGYLPATQHSVLEAGVTSILRLPTATPHCHATARRSGGWLSSYRTVPAATNKHNTEEYMGHIAAVSFLVPLPCTLGFRKSSQPPSGLPLIPSWSSALLRHTCSPRSVNRTGIRPMTLIPRPLRVPATTRSPLQRRLLHPSRKAH